MKTMIRLKPLEVKMNGMTIELSKREQNFLKLLAEERSTQDIAIAFHLSHRTVESLRDDLKKKFGVKTLFKLGMLIAKLDLTQ